ncbi:MAG: hypothetical protein IPK26_03470 [Planctomycetes bacterium]|nr:hypothetical protein [Planctomycetota bacterium]
MASSTRLAVLILAMAPALAQEEGGGVVILDSIVVEGTPVRLGQQAAPLEVTRWLANAPAADARPAWRLVGIYGGAGYREFRDDAEYLADLRQKHADAGLSIRIVLGDAPPEGALAKSPLAVALDEEGTTVAAWRADPELPPLYLLDAGDQVVWAGRAAHGLVDVLPLALAGRLGVAHEQELQNLRAELAMDFENAGDRSDELQKHLQERPHDGDLHGLLFLTHLWHRADPAAAAAMVEPALQALGTEALPLAAFVDLVLRGDRFETGLAGPLAMAMTPAAAAARDSAFVQLAFLRATLRAGLDRQAGRIAAALPKLLAGRPREQLIFAEILAEAKSAAPFRDLFDQAIGAVAERTELQRFSFAARYKMALACGDAKAAQRVMDEYRTGRAESFGLNNDAWYIATQLVSLGRFDAFGLAQAEEMRRQEGDSLDYNSKDTLALLLFLNGKVGEAIELQATAVKQGGPQFQQRLQRYERTQERLRQASGGRTDR